MERSRFPGPRIHVPGRPARGRTGAPQPLGGSFQLFRRENGAFRQTGNLDDAFGPHIPIASDHQGPEVVALAGLVRPDDGLVDHVARMSREAFRDTLDTYRAQRPNGFLFQREITIASGETPGH